MIVAGAVLGVVNTVLTEAVMRVAPVERPIASSAYSFVRFAGGAVAPWLAGKLAEWVAPDTPFFVGAAAVLVALGVLVAGRAYFAEEEESRSRRRRRSRRCSSRSTVRRGERGHRRRGAARRDAWRGVEVMHVHETDVVGEEASTARAARWPPPSSRCGWRSCERRGVGGGEVVHTFGDRGTRCARPRRASIAVGAQAVVVGRRGQVAARATCRSSPRAARATATRPSTIVARPQRNPRPPSERGGLMGSCDRTERAVAKVIAFANQKGGVAKTTTTLNLAAAFAEEGHRVLCIDMDPQGNLTMSQGIDPETLDESMFDVLVHDMPIKQVIYRCEIDVAVASIDLAGAEIAMSVKIGRERSLDKALRVVHDDYDFICIDTPPSLGLLTVNALTAADKVIVPVQCEYLSMRGLLQLQNTLSMIRENLNPTSTSWASSPRWWIPGRCMPRKRSRSSRRTSGTGCSGRASRRPSVSRKHP